MREREREREKERYREAQRETERDRERERRNNRIKFYYPFKPCVSKNPLKTVRFPTKL